MPTHDHGAMATLDPLTPLFTNIHTEIPIPRDQPAGLFWYCPHRHMSSSKQSWEGMAGAIIVEGAIDQIQKSRRPKERPMIISGTLARRSERCADSGCGSASLLQFSSCRVRDWRGARMSGPFPAPPHKNCS